MIDWITPTLAIGTRADAELLVANSLGGFRSVLSLDGPLQGVKPGTIGRFLSYALIDGPGNDSRLFLRAVNAVAKLLATDAPLLVHCHAGRSRSPVVVAAHFARTLGVDPEEALAMVRAKREVNITAGLERLLWMV